MTCSAPGLAAMVDWKPGVVEKLADIRRERLAWHGDPRRARCPRHAKKPGEQLAALAGAGPQVLRRDAPVADGTADPPPDRPPMTRTHRRAPRRPRQRPPGQRGAERVRSDRQVSLG